MPGRSRLRSRVLVVGLIALAVVFVACSNDRTIDVHKRPATTPTTSAPPAPARLTATPTNDTAPAPRTPPGSDDSTATGGTPAVRDQDRLQGEPQNGPLMEPAGDGRVSDERPVLMLADDDCSPTRVLIPASSPSEVLVVNQGSEPLVLTIPRFAVSLEVVPGGRSLLPVNPFLAGTFEYYCLSASAHVAAGGHAGIGLLACPIDPVRLDSVAHASGLLEVERHQQVR